MAYLHCHSCDWSQDDFWSESYSPIKSDIIKWFHELLLRRMVKVDRGPDMGCVDVDTREYVAEALERRAITIREMAWRTEAEWKEARETAVCPKCGARDFDID